MNELAAVNHGLIVDLILLTVVISIGLFLYYQCQSRLSNLVQDTPIAILQIDKKTGQVVDANRMAMQTLGVRHVGRRYLVPPLMSCEILLEMIQSANKQEFKRWQVSESRSIQVQLTTNSTTVFRRPIWVVHALPVSNNIASSSEGYIKDYLAKFALDSISELVFFKDENGQVSGTNRAYDRFWLEREAESCAKLSWDDQTSRATVKRWTTLPTGESCLLETHISALMGDAGIPIGTIGITHDVTEWYNTEQSFLYEMERRQNMEIELAQRDTMLQSLMNASPDPIAIFNQNRVHEACNQPYADSLGIANPDMLIGQRLENLLPIELVERFKQSDLEVLKEGKTIRFVDTTENTAGELNWYDIVKAPYTDPLSNTTGCLLMARDITARMHAEQQLAQANAELEQLSFFDELTKVANRRRFEVELKAIWALHLRQSSPFTIIICDIDYFKKYNQLYGREQGDITLTKVAQALKSVPLRGADLVARYLDGQFVFLLPETKMPGCLHIADKIHQVIADLNIEHAKSPISDKLTVSLGVSSLIPRRSMLESEFIALAEDALAQAKEKGRMQTQVQLLNDDYTPTIHASRRGGVDESN